MPPQRGELLAGGVGLVRVLPPVADCEELAGEGGSVRLGRRERLLHQRAIARAQHLERRQCRVLGGADHLGVNEEEGALGGGLLGLAAGRRHLLLRRLRLDDAPSARRRGGGDRRAVELRTQLGVLLAETRDLRRERFLGVGRDAFAHGGDEAVEPRARR